MARIHLELDDDLVRAAAAALGTRTVGETVNAALREVVTLDARRRDLTWLLTDPARVLAGSGARVRGWRV